MATQEELADLERMSNDYVPDAKVLIMSLPRRGYFPNLEYLGTSSWRTTVNAGAREGVCPSAPSLCAQDKGSPNLSGFIR